MSDEERMNAFLSDLRALTIKHGVAIAGCGCCGSPFLEAGVDVSDSRAGYVHEHGSDVMWVAPSNAYHFDKRSSEIVG